MRQQLPLNIQTDIANITTELSQNNDQMHKFKWVRKTKLNSQIQSAGLIKLSEAL